MTRIVNRRARKVKILTKEYSGKAKVEGWNTKGGSSKAIVNQW